MKRMFCNKLDSLSILKPVIWVLILWNIATPFSNAQQKDELQRASDAYVYQGNAVLDEDFIEAEKYYRKAISKKATNTKSAYNLGSAYYASGLYDEALLKLIEATENGTKKEKHAAFHNIGNTLMQEKKCKEAVEAYKNALRNNPADEESRYNLALAIECAKEQGGGGKDKEKEQDEKEQDQKEDSEKQQDQNEQNKEKGDQDPKEDPSQKDDQGKPEDKEGEQKNPSPKNQQGKLSPQQIKNLLEAMNNEEKKTQEKMNATKTKGVKIKTEKDW